MQVATFPCPHCSIPLRVRDRTYLHRTIACPECGKSVRISATANGTLHGMIEQPADVPAQPTSVGGRLTPNRIAWGVAVVMTLALVVFIMFPRGRTPEEIGQIVDRDGPVDPPQRPAAEKPGVPPAEQSPVKQQLLKLHGQIAPLLERDGHFPIGTVPSEELAVFERFSWLATIIAAAEPDGPRPHWDRAWNDPINDRFVRRQQPLLLNPALDRVVGKDRYPTTHFVGVAGVGADAATLPAHHPRAGIFGHDRRVDIADVRDGLANTMLVAGVESRLGSWAAGGDVTVRGFTEEPYLRGPDGFGTGQADGMHVLMADGSVRFLSKDTSPVIVRRLAAMNDGLPLDVTVPGEPGESSEPDTPPLAANDANPEPVPEDKAGEEAIERTSKPVDPETPAMDLEEVIAELAHPRDQPIDVPMAEPAAVYDIDAALSQKILEFDQSDPVSVRDLLRLVEEMAAVPIHLDELPPELAPLLAEPLTVSLKSTTVGEILTAILQQANLSFEGRPEGIVIQPPSASSAEAN